jgi:hypothetical protein
MNIKKFNEFSQNEEVRTELYGNVDRLPSNIVSRHDQEFYNYYTRGRFSGLSKYELNTKMFDLAQRKDEIGIIAQFCLQIERESIKSSSNLTSSIEDLSKKIEEIGITKTSYFNDKEIPIEGNLD